MKKIKGCINCKSKDFYLVESIDHKPFRLSVYSCSNCGLFFQNPMPTKTFMTKFYEDIYKKRFHFISTEKAFEIEDKKQERGRISEIEKFVKGGKILDIGASTGFFLKEVQKRKHWEVFGIEYSKEAIKKAKGRYNFPVVLGEAGTKKLPKEFFDVVTMHSVLEHIPDPVGAVRKVYMKLKPGGYFVFNVPNIRSFEYYLFKMLNKRFPGFISEHLYYFTPKVITNILEKNGFRVIHMTSRHHSTLRFPGVRPFISLMTFFPKLFLEYTDLGSKLKLGNIVYVYAKKVN